jgi:short-subunit dehydrogenase
MKELRDRIALLTGASGGLGKHIARPLAAEGVRLVLSGRNGEALGRVRDELAGRGAQVAVVGADLREAKAIDELVDQVEAEVGPIDILVNNAGLEVVSSFTNSSREELDSILAVNLMAPMLLIHRVLPGMLTRGRGHVVNISSLAGKVGAPYAAPYAAAKAGLIGLTQSLRNELAGSPVGCSVICPGFVAGDGMYGRIEAQGIKAPLAFGASRPERVGRAVVRSIVKDLPEVILNPRPVRPVLELGVVAPRQVERVMRATGATEVFRRLAEINGRL